MENRDKIKFGAQFPSEHAGYNRIHQKALLDERNMQNIAILLPFSLKLRFENLPL